MMRRQWKLNLGRAVATALFVIFCAAAHAAPKYKVLHNFTGSDGSGPQGGVAFGPDGGLYGTGGSGGFCGTVFELTPMGNGQWQEAVIYQFGSSQDGCGPQGRVIFDAAGNLYDTAADGGNPDCAYGCGVVFQLVPGSSGNWTENVLFPFDFNDGAHPTAGVIMDNQGNLYGTAEVAFELVPSVDGWNEIVLHYFTGKNGDGMPPVSGLISDGSGNLYGTTEGGGTGCGSTGCGTVYELTIAGGIWKEKVLHRFDTSGKGGVTPGSGLLMDASGSLYGTTASGGCCGGVVFKLTPGGRGRWKETVLHGFKGGAGGDSPWAGVVMDKAGSLYGTTVYGGSDCDCGLIYKLTPGPKGKWKYTVLHTFYGWDGAIPEGNLVLDDNGNLYGGTVLGGTGNGVIFELSP